jgi:hypothetical protein
MGYAPAEHEFDGAVGVLLRLLAEGVCAEREYAAHVTCGTEASQFHRDFSSC